MHSTTSVAPQVYLLRARRRRGLLLGMMMSLSVGGYLLWSPPSAPTPAGEQTTSRPGARPGAPATVHNTNDSTHTSASRQEEHSPVSPLDEQTLRPLKPEKLITRRQRLRAEVLAENPTLQRFHELKRRVLPDQQSRLEYEALLMDDALLAAASQSLRETPTAFDERQQLKRMEEITFLGEALRWEENPSRSMTLDAIVAALQAPNLSADQPLDVQKALAGDKWELYYMLLMTDPAMAADVMEAAEGTPLYPVLEYAQLRYLAWTQQEG